MKFQGKTVVFPAREGQRYWKLHYKYVQNSLVQAGFKLHFARGMNLDTTRFRMKFMGREIVIDFSDFFDFHPIVESGIPYFKFHVPPGHPEYPNVFPIGPVSVDNWAPFLKLQAEKTFQADGALILNNQRAYGGAKARRRDVRKLLGNSFPGRVDFTLRSQEQFWALGFRSLLSVCVPGARNDILDRGQIQYMGLGICTLSPPLKASLAGGLSPEPNVHYLACKPDYSDLVERINYADQHRELCREIGRNGKKMFAACIPQAKWSWVEQKISSI